MYVRNQRTRPKIYGEREDIVRICPDAEDKISYVRIHKSHYPHLLDTERENNVYMNIEKKMSASFRVLSTHSSYVRINSIVRICPNTEHFPPLIKTGSKRVEAAVLTATNTKTSVCWAVPSCSLVITYRRFGYNFSLQLHNRMKNHPDRVCTTHYFRALNSMVPPKRRTAYLCTRLHGDTPHKIEVFSTMTF